MAQPLSGTRRFSNSKGRLSRLSYRVLQPWQLSHITIKEGHKRLWGTLRFAPCCYLFYFFVYLRVFPGLTISRGLNVHDFSSALKSLEWAVRMHLRTVAEVKVVDVQKRRNPSKHYVSWFIYLYLGTVLRTGQHFVVNYAVSSVGYTDPNTNIVV